MNKQTIQSGWINTTALAWASAAMILLSLLVSFGVELLMKALFRLG
jgi:hypothetical protein